MKNKIILLSIVSGVLFLCGCVRTEVESERLTFGSRGKKNYAPVQSRNIKLELSGNGQFFAGEGGWITFILINNGTRPVAIEEWYANEPDNLVLSCQNWLPDMETFDPQAWIKFDVTPRQPAWRHPLQLAPGGRMFIKKQLPFIDKLNITPGSERRFFIKVDSNLNSLKLDSKIVAISVRNPADKRIKQLPKTKSRHFER